MKFKVITDHETFELVETDAPAAARAAACKIRGRVFALTGPRGGSPKFYLVRGTTPYPISARVAALENAMNVP
jgi:hypothetical protein